MFSLRHALKFTSANRVNTPALAGRVVIQGHRWTRTQVPLTQGFEFSLEVLHITGPHTQKISAEDFHKCTQNFLTLRWVTVHDVYWTIFCVIVFMSPAVPACTSSRQLGLLTVDIPHRRRGRERGSWDSHWRLYPHLPPSCVQFCRNCSWPQERTRGQWLGEARHQSRWVHTFQWDRVSPCRPLTVHSLSVGESNTLIASSRVN